MNWPNDVDGDVFRRLNDSNFNFSIKHTIDFNIDFDHWPPQSDVVNRLQNKYSHIKIIEHSDEYSGYISFQIHNKLTYSLVIKIQKDISELVKPYGGICESWGVMQD
jgi:hypothetical protein